MSIIWKYDCEWYWTAVCVWHKWWMSFLINVKYQIYFSSYVVLMMCNFRIGTNSLWYLQYIYASSWHETSSIDSGFLLCDYISSKTIWNGILLYNACSFMRSFMERLTVCDIYIYIVTSKYYVNEQINKRWFKNSRKKYVVGIKKEYTLLCHKLAYLMWLRNKMVYVFISHDNVFQYKTLFLFI